MLKSRIIIIINLFKVDNRTKKRINKFTFIALGKIG